MSCPVGGANIGAAAQTSMNMATAKLHRCRLCWENVSTKIIINIFTRKSMEKGWGRRINTLLEISVSQDEELPAYIYNKCTTRIVTLEKIFEQKIKSLGVHLTRSKNCPPPLLSPPPPPKF